MNWRKAQYNIENILNQKSNKSKIMSELKVNGTIKLIYDTQTFDSGFQKREFVVTTAEQYPQDIKIEMIKDKCEVLDGYAVGQSVEVSINLRGNEYNGKYYVNIQGWKINAAEAAEATPAPLQPNEEAADDLPF